MKPQTPNTGLRHHSLSHCQIRSSETVSVFICCFLSLSITVHLAYASTDNPNRLSQDGTHFCKLRRCLAAFPDLLVHPNVSEGAVLSFPDLLVYPNVSQGAVLAFPDLLVYPNVPEGADSVGGQLRENKACAFSGVTNSARVWRKMR